MECVTGDGILQSADDSAVIVGWASWRSDAKATRKSGVRAFFLDVSPLNISFSTPAISSLEIISFRVRIRVRVRKFLRLNSSNRWKCARSKMSRGGECPAPEVREIHCHCWDHRCFLQRCQVLLVYVSLFTVDIIIIISVIIARSLTVVPPWRGLWLSPTSTAFVARRPCLRRCVKKIRYGGVNQEAASSICRVSCRHSLQSLSSIGRLCRSTFWMLLIPVARSCGCWSSRPVVRVRK